MKRTELDNEFEEVLSKCHSLLLEINQKAVNAKEDNIKSASCYLCEIIDTYLANSKGGC